MSNTESERAKEISRTIEQLEQMANECIADGHKEAARLRGLADDLARRESIRVESERQQLDRVEFGSERGQ